MRLAVQPLLVAPDPGRQAEGLEAELRLTLPSDIRLVEDVVDVVARHLEERFVDRHSVRFNLRVALSEALINAILYGNGEDDTKGVALRVLFGRHAVEMEVTDEGEGYDYHVLPDPTLPANRLRPCGRGVFLIRQLVDEVRFNDTGNSICMILRRT
ncbi:MAG TPA: ATP-binding protein [Gemmatimonadales bacterium]|nr:ATP-binding protein [Gemmatimonadales bacterium]